ncbi:MAG: TlpA family protein disulfide reductase [Acidobacteria bacterium]|nr:TlpA family protein disulfide reductase [Acidobacteriota bacterium]
MRKLLLLFVVANIFAHVAGAQSGRKLPPAPPPSPPSSATITREQDDLPAPARSTSRAELDFLPENVLSRELQTLRRESFRLTDYKGKIVVLNIWASWCGPCRRETPEMEEMSHKYAPRGVEFIGLTAENPATDAQRVQAFVRDSKVSYRIGWVDRATAVALMNGRNVIPQTFVIKGNGEIVGHLVGYGPSSAARLRALIDRALTGDNAEQ